METPTIEVIGTAGNMFKITDHEGTVRRVPKVGGVTGIYDSSNDTVHRLDISTPRSEIILVFPDVATLTAAVALIDAEY